MEYIYECLVCGAHEVVEASIHTPRAEYEPVMHRVPGKGARMKRCGQMTRVYNPPAIDRTSLRGGGGHKGHSH